MLRFDPKKASNVEIQNTSTHTFECVEKVKKNHIRFEVNPHIGLIAPTMKQNSEVTPNATDAPTHPPHPPSTPLAWLPHPALPFTMTSLHLVLIPCPPCPCLTTSLCSPTLSSPFPPLPLPLPPCSPPPSPFLLPSSPLPNLGHV